MRARHKRWAEPYLEEHPDIVILNLADHVSFFMSSPLYLEIGAGKGDFVLAMAEKGGSWVALEREISICGLLSKKVVDSGLANIVVYPSDFDVAAEALKTYVFDGIYLNFSDPWPKKRHWKRRLTTASRLFLMTSLLKEGGRLYFKSDNLALYEFTKDEASKVAGLRLVLDQPDYAFDASSDAMSEYERNFRSQGLPIHRLVYEKTSV